MSASEKQPGYRQKVGYQAILLGAFATLATALLIFGNIATKGAIKQRQQEDLLDSLAQVIPAKYYDNDLLANPLQLSGANNTKVVIYRATKSLKVTALAWEIIGIGYAGEIKLIIGVDAAGRILGARVLAHAETPGLGDKIELQKDKWILGFNGLSLGNPSESKWAVKKDGGQFDAFTGATITPRGVVKAIKQALLFFKQHQTALLAPPAISKSLEKSQ